MPCPNCACPNCSSYHQNPDFNLRQLERQYYAGPIAQEDWQRLNQSRNRVGLPRLPLLNMVPNIVDLWYQQLLDSLEDIEDVSPDIPKIYHVCTNRHIVTMHRGNYRGVHLWLKQTEETGRNWPRIIISTSLRGKGSRNNPCLEGCLIFYQNRISLSIRSHTRRRVLHNIYDAIEALDLLVDGFIECMNALQE